MIEKSLSSIACYKDKFNKVLPACIQTIENSEYKPICIMRLIILFLALIETSSKPLLRLSLPCVNFTCDFSKDLFLKIKLILWKFHRLLQKSFFFSEDQTEIVKITAVNSQRLFLKPTLV